MKVKALIPFTSRNGSTGELVSVACGQVIEVTDEVGASLISDGLAEAYTLVEPTGTKSITANANNIDVSAYAKADVNVPSVQPSGSLNITVNGTYDISDKASVVVNVGIVTLTVNGNGAIWESEIGEQYSFLHQIVAGSSVQESDIQAGWHDSEYNEVTILGYSSTKAKADAHDHDITFPLTVTANTTIYLDWTAQAGE